jgi:hypothetical protein
MRLGLCSVILAGVLTAAAPDPVAWTVGHAPPKPLKGGARFSATVVAHIQDGWHMYG